MKEDEGRMGVRKQRKVLRERESEKVEKEIKDEKEKRKKPRFLFQNMNLNNKKVIKYNQTLFSREKKKTVVFFKRTRRE